MSIRIAALTAALLFAPPAAFAPTAFAHGEKPVPAHGGIVADESGEHWVELAVAGDQVTAWVSDANNKPVPAAQLGGKATVLIGGRTQTVALSPADANSVTGKLAAPATGRVTAVLALTAGGKPVQVKFVVPAK
jgi:hypothetical protein